MARRIDRARALRRDPSRAEKICWDLLRAHRMADLKFRRQHPVGPYFADFACVSKKLVIEIDGNFHDDQIAADGRRTAEMETLGWRVLRFAASEVVQNREGIWTTIEMALREPAFPLSQPLPLAGERSMKEELGRLGTIHHAPTQDGEAIYRPNGARRILLPMLNRRSLTIGGLATVAVSSLPYVAAAADGKPILVFMGNEQ